MFGRAKTFIQDWIEDKQVTKRLEGKYREDARVSHIREEKAYNEYVSETRTENKIAAQSWQSDLGEGYMADIANGQRQNDLVDRMTSMESGRLPGTTPTFEPRSSIEAGWNPQTGTFQSAAVQFALEAPNAISHEEFAQSHQTERADGKIDTPQQTAFEFGENETEYGNIAIGGFNVNGQWVDGDNSHEDFWATDDKEAANIAQHNHEKTERQWNHPGYELHDDDMER